jgi:hypothetical protein
MPIQHQHTLYMTDKEHFRRTNKKPITGNFLETSNNRFLTIKVAFIAKYAYLSVH